MRFQVREGRTDLFRRWIAGCIVWAIIGSTGVISMARAEEKKVPVTFSDGHETDKKDHGRPVVLIAAALGVKTEVFREAFSGVTPAKNGRPSGEEARANKEALMKVLKPHGITNDRLDEVSNFYRYQPQKSELWKHTDAKGHAIVADGQVKRIVITEPGAGYSSVPKVSIKGLDGIELRATVKYDKDLKKNGSISAVEIVEPEPASSKK